MTLVDQPTWIGDQEASPTDRVNISVDQDEELESVNFAVSLDPRGSVSKLRWLL